MSANAIQAQAAFLVVPVCYGHQWR